MRKYLSLIENIIINEQVDLETKQKIKNNQN